MGIMSKIRTIQATRSEADNAAIEAAKAATPAHLRRSSERAGRPYLVYDAKNGEAVVWVVNAYEYRAALKAVGAEWDSNTSGWKMAAARIADIAAIIPA